MNISSDTLIENFVEAFHALEGAIGALVASFQKTPMPIWSHNQTEHPMEWLEIALGDLWYKDGQAGNESTPYVGLVGAAPEHMRLVHEVNAAKHVLQLSGQALKSQAPAGFNHAKSRVGAERRQVQPHLNSAGLARLHLKQAWRRLPVAEDAVRRVHFSWYSSGRMIKRMTVSEVEKALSRLDADAPHIRIQMRKLASLRGDEMLAQVKPQTSLVRANIAFMDPLPTLKMHMAMNVGMPLFVPIALGEELPDHNEPSPHPPIRRSWPKRCDAKLADEPFLPSVHVHRYRDNEAAD